MAEKSRTKRTGQSFRALLTVGQGNRTSEQGEEAGEIGVVPSGPLKLAAQRLL
jgi:hypothetical protein